MLHRAYSLLEIKTVDEEERILEGVASTPRPDRMEDIVEPLGAEFTLPIPFLWQHESKESAVGDVFFAKPTKDGIPVRIKIEKDDVPGILKDRLDYAWRSIKKKLVRGLSIGFTALESEPIKGTFGLRFLRWEWLELSAVTIPANAEATIQTIKQYDLRSNAASGTSTVVTKTPGVTGPVKLIPPKALGERPMLTEQITTLESTLATKRARMNEIQKAASDAGNTKDEAQREEFDTIRDEIKALDVEIKDLRELEAMNAAAAVPAVGTTTEKAAASRGGQPAAIQLVEKLDPGIEFARFAMCLAAAQGNPTQALKLAENHYPQQKRAISVLKSAVDNGMSMGRWSEAVVARKDAVAGGTTTHATWAEPLLAYNTYVGDFVEFLRPRTLIGQFGQNGVPDLKRIPFNVHIKAQTSGGTGYWVGEGKPKPVTKYDFLDTYHGFTKVAAIAVLTEELIRFSDPSAERLVRDALGESLIARADTTFIDPSLDAVTGVSPASITFGVTGTSSSGATADDIREDIQQLWSGSIAANLPMTSAVYITTPSIGLALALQINPLGQREFPDMTMNGGRLLGVPVIVSNYVPVGLFILAFASEIYLSDDGTATVDASREASIQMLDNPTNDVVTPTATAMVSMFQTDSVALRAHRLINWSKRRATAVAVLTDVAWNGAPTS